MKYLGIYLRRLLLSRINMGIINCKGTEHTDVYFPQTINERPEPTTKRT
jgi:hypothetical protein